MAPLDLEKGVRMTPNIVGPLTWPEKLVQLPSWYFQLTGELDHGKETTRPGNNRPQTGGDAVRPHEAGAENGPLATAQNLRRLARYPGAGPPEIPEMA
jgi:hypothetical protein